MNICVIGCGYVGLVAGACLSKFHDLVICVDNNLEKIEKLNNGIVNIFEPGLDKIIQGNQKLGKLKFTNDLKDALAQCDVCFIAVGTPLGKQGSLDTSFVFSVARNIGQVIDKHILIVQKSTLPVSYNAKVKEAIQTELNKRECNITFDFIVNPEFLREGSAVEDFLNPNKIVIGSIDENSAQNLKSIYSPLNIEANKYIVCNFQTAELIKYSSNVMLASRVALINEISRICDVFDADVDLISEAIGLDPRIGQLYLQPSFGYGGSCLPKDVSSLGYLANQNNIKVPMIEAIGQSNLIQTENFVLKIFSRFNNDVSDKKFCLWGLTFKAGSNDLRFSPSISAAKMMLDKCAGLNVFDPETNDCAKEELLDLQNINFCNDMYEATKNCDALILATDWSYFKNADFKKVKSLLSKPIIFDGRNTLSDQLINSLGFEYYKMGKINV